MQPSQPLWWLFAALFRTSADDPHPSPPSGVNRNCEDDNSSKTWRLFSWKKAKIRQILLLLQCKQWRKRGKEKSKGHGKAPPDDRRRLVGV
jgi:hypothetical protein